MRSLLATGPHALRSAVGGRTGGRRRWQSAAPPVVSPATRPLDFNDPVAAYRPKTNWELARAYIVFRLCALPWLVRHSTR